MAKRSSETILAMPDTKVLSGTRLRNEAVQLLLDAEAHMKTINEAEIAMKKIKARLVEIQIEHNVPNLRHNRFCAIVSYRNGAARLSREKLIENGVDPEVIKASTVQGDPYTVCEFDWVK